jgi:hypothetical protein
MKFMRMDQFQQNDFLKLSLHPDPEDDYQAKEWGIFMRFLRENKKVNIISSVCIFIVTTCYIFKSPFQENKTVGELGHLVTVL